MMIAVLRRLLMIYLAYGLAALASGFLVAHTEYAIQPAEMITVTGYAFLVSIMIALYAAPFAAATALIGEFRGIRRWWFYAAAGSLTGLVLGLMFKGPQWFPWGGLGYGAVAGLIFWVLAGRRAGLLAEADQPASQRTVQIAMALTAAMTIALISLSALA